MIEPKSKYWELIHGDGIVQDFNKLFKKCSSLSSEIRRGYLMMFMLCNVGFSDLLSGTRLLIDTHSKDSTGSYVGFGANGFGYAYSPACNIYYDPHTLYDNKDFVIKYKAQFRKKVKKAIDFKDRFDLCIKVMSTIPKLTELINRFTGEDIIIKSYNDDIHFDTIEIKSAFLSRYEAVYKIKLSSNGGHSSILSRNDIEQDVDCYHLYETINGMLVKHLKELVIIDNRMIRFRQGNDYKELKELIDTIRFTKIL